MEQTGGCHCGKVRFKAQVDITKGMSCNCSICAKRGSILSFVPVDQFQLVSGADSLTEYLFNKHKIRHQFCKVCGILPFAGGEAPNGAKMQAINLRCIDGIEVEKINVQVYDGKNL